MSGPMTRGGMRNFSSGMSGWSRPGMITNGVQANNIGIMDQLNSLFPSTAPSISGIGGTSPDWLSMDGFFGSKGADGITHNGWGGTALGGIQAIGDMYSSMKQFGLAEDQFEEGKRQYDQNYQAQVKNYNTDLEDRQRARVASNSGGYQSVSDYMAKNRQV